MREVNIVGVGMTPFGKFPTQTFKTLGATAMGTALHDAGLTARDVQLVVHGNAMGGVLSGQHMVRGQLVAAGAGLAGVPLINVENACATSSTGIHLAVAAIKSGLYDTVVVCGTEKMTTARTPDVLQAMLSGTDVDRLPEILEDVTGSREGAESFFMELYAGFTRDYLARTDATVEDFAAVAAKNSIHGSLNPLAQYRQRRTAEEVLASRVVRDPLHVLMCAPIADGAAAVVLQADEVTRDKSRAVRVRSSAMLSGQSELGEHPIEARTSAIAYEQAGVGPQDIDVVEIHDAASPNEFMMAEALGICGPGEAPSLFRNGATTLGGRVPFNPSGGLVSKGHPVGATGCAQIVELTEQLRGEAGDRQVHGARLALAENAGGYTHPESAACVVTILGKQVA